MMMHLSADISSALQQLESIKQAIDDSHDPKLQLSTSEDLDMIISLLQDPVFRSIVTTQDSLGELNSQIAQHPSILPGDFDITTSGDLVLTVPPPIDLYDNEYTDEQRVPSAQLSPGSPQSLGYSVVGGQSGDALALHEGDQILAIDGQPIDSNISHQQAINILQKAKGLVELVVARSGTEDDRCSSIASGGSSSKAGASSSDMILGTEWAQVEAIDLVNDGTGLGFGIIGARTSGVIVKTILPGGVADRDGRLQSGDHILQIGSVNLHRMQSEHVAAVLRQSGTHVRLVVARPIDPVERHGSAPVVPTRLLADPIELDAHLIAAGYPEIFGNDSSSPSPSPTTDTHPTSFIYNADTHNLPLAGSRLSMNLDLPEMEKFAVELKKDFNGLGITIAGYVCEKEELSGIFVKSVSPGSAADLSGRIQVNDRIVEVDGQSLQGYSNHQAVDVLKSSGTVVRLCLERYLRGPKYEQLQQAIAANELKPSTPATPPHVPVLHRSTNEDIRSSASRFLVTQNDVNTNIPIVNERIKEGGINPEDRKRKESVISVQSDKSVCSTHALRKNSNHSVHSDHSSIHEAPLKSDMILNPAHLLSNERIKNDLHSFTLPHAGRENSGSKGTSYKNQATISLAPVQSMSLDRKSKNVENLPTAEHFVTETPVDDEICETSNVDLAMLRNNKQFENELTPSVEEAIKVKWTKIVGEETEIVVAQLRKFGASGGLGISLEGTVDVEDGREVRPHHYIRSILPEGPVGRHGALRSGDELLEVNGFRLLGMNHIEVVSILKELPIGVRMVCGRGPPCPPDMYMPPSPPRGKLGGSLQNLMPATDRLVKAKSDGSLATSGNSADSSFTKMKSRSLEPLTGLAMWSSEPQIIELMKGERGLGFSILDYQDPIDPNDTVIVIRSLVPGGVAQLDGRLIPGDRLLFVNETVLENASLDQAVQALKGAPKGIVKIGVAKPLPIADSSLNPDRSEVSFEPRQLAPTPMTPTTAEQMFFTSHGEIKIN